MGSAVIWNGNAFGTPFPLAKANPVLNWRKKGSHRDHGDHLPENTEKPALLSVFSGVNDLLSVNSA